MLTEVKTMKYEVKAYEFQTGAKTFRLTKMTWGSYCVVSYLTAKPTAKSFWGTKTFATLAEIEQHYKSLRGISKLIGEEF